MSNNNKMKGLLKGLRYISQIFDNEKEPEMQIGYPTDVKHVAHIGWDGPSVNSPSWMNEFQGPPGFQSAPLNANGEVEKDANSVKWVSEDSSWRVSKNKSSQSTDTPELPKSSRRQSTSSSAAAESIAREKSEKSKLRKSSKTSAKDISDGSKTTRKPKDPTQGTDSQAPDIPKKTRRKKSKDSSVGGGSSRSRNRAHSPDGDGSVSRAHKSDLCQRSGLNPFEDG